MAQHRKSYRYTYWLLFLYLVLQPLFPSIWAAPDFTVPTPSGQLTQEVVSGVATEAQFGEIESAATKLLETDSRLMNFLDTNFVSDGDYGETKNGTLVEDWESIAKTLGISVTVLVAAYGLWRGRRKSDLSLLRSGNPEGITQWLEEQVDTKKSLETGGFASSEHGNDTRAFLKNGKTLTSLDDWNKFANAKGLAGMGATLMSLYLLWRRREQYDEVLNKEKDKTKINTNPQWSQFNMYLEVEQVKGQTQEVSDILTPEEVKLESQYKSKLESELASITAPTAPERSEEIDQYEALKLSIPKLEPAIQTKQQEKTNYTNQLRSYTSTVNYYQNVHDNYRAQNAGVINAYERYENLEKNGDKIVAQLQTQYNEKSSLRQSSYQIYINASNEYNTASRNYQSQWNSGWNQVNQQIVNRYQIQQLNRSLFSYESTQRAYLRSRDRYPMYSSLWNRFNVLANNMQIQAQQIRRKLALADSPSQKYLTELKNKLSELNTTKSHITSYGRTEKVYADYVAQYTALDLQYPGRYTSTIAYFDRIRKQFEGLKKASEVKLESAKAYLKSVDQSRFGARWKTMNLDRMVTDLELIAPKEAERNQAQAVYNQSANDLAQISNKLYSQKQSIRSATYQKQIYQARYNVIQTQLNQYKSYQNTYKSHQTRTQKSLASVDQALEILKTKKLEQESQKKSLESIYTKYQSEKEAYEQELSVYRAENKTITEKIQSQLAAAKVALAEKVKAFWDSRRQKELDEIIKEELYDEKGEVRQGSQYFYKVQEALAQRNQKHVDEAENQYRKKNSEPVEPIQSSVVKEYQELYRENDNALNKIQRNLNEKLQSADSYKAKIDLALKAMEDFGTAHSMADEKYKNVWWPSQPSWYRQGSVTYSAQQLRRTGMNILNQYRGQIGEAEYQRRYAELWSRYTNRSSYYQKKAQEIQYKNKLNQYHQAKKTWNQNMQEVKEDAKIGKSEDSNYIWEYRNKAIAAEDTKKRLAQKIIEFSTKLKQNLTTQKSEKKKSFDGALVDLLDGFSESEIEQLRSGGTGVGLGLGKGEGLYGNLAQYINDVGRAQDRKDRIAQLEKDIPNAEARIRTWKKSRSYYKYQGEQVWQADKRQLDLWKSQLSQLQAESQAYEEKQETQSKAEFYSMDQVDFESDLKTLIPDYEITRDYAAEQKEIETQLKSIKSEYQVKVNAVDSGAKQYGNSYAAYVRTLPNISAIRSFWTYQQWEYYRGIAQSRYEQNAQEARTAYESKQKDLERKKIILQQSQKNEEAIQSQKNRYAEIARKEYGALRERVSAKKRAAQFLRQLDSAGSQSAYFTTLKSQIGIADQYQSEAEKLEETLEGRSPFDAEMEKLKQEMGKPNSYSFEEFKAMTLKRHPQVTTVSIHDMWRQRRQVGYNGILDHLEQKASNYARSYANSTNVSPEVTKTLKGLYENVAQYKLQLYKDWPSYYQSHPLVHEYQQKENQTRLNQLVAAQTKWKQNLQDRVNTMQEKKASVLSQLTTAKTWLSQTSEERAENNDTQTIVSQETALLERYQSGEDVTETLRGETQLERSLEGLRLAQENGKLELEIMSQKPIQYSYNLAKEKLTAQYMGTVSAYEKQYRYNATAEGSAAIWSRMENQAQKVKGEVLEGLGVSSLNGLRNGYFIQNPSTFNPSSMGGSRQDRLDEKYGRISATPIAPIQVTQTREESAKDNPYWNPSETPAYAKDLDTAMISSILNNYREQRRVESLKRQEAGVWSNVTTGNTYTELKPEPEVESTTFAAVTTESKEAEVKEKLLNLSVDTGLDDLLKPKYGARVDIGIVKEKQSQEKLDKILSKFKVENSKKEVFTPEIWGIKRDNYSRAITDNEITMINTLSSKEEFNLGLIYNRASNIPTKEYPVSEKWDSDLGDFSQDGHRDAFRHVYLSYSLSKKFGTDWTRKLLTHHEGISGNPQTRKAMDLYNNEVGFYLHFTNSKLSEKELITKIKDEINNGTTVLIDKKGNLEFSSEVEVGEHGFPNISPK